MADIINLQQARKQRDRAQKEARSAAKRADFGRSKGHKKKDSADRQKSRRELDGKKLKPGPDDAGT